MSDAAERLEAWQRLADPASAALLVEADELISAGVTPAGISTLRRRHPASPIPEALELADARRRARSKFSDAAGLLLDRQGVEQATSDRVATWKAARFGDRSVLDLCCGIGGDAMALARRGPCVGVDLDPVRAFMTARNAGIETRISAVEETPLDAPLVHLDPARRDESSGRRSWRLDDLRPGVDVIRRIVDSVEGAAVKLGPGLPLPAPRWHERQSISVIAEHGRLVQAVIWTGDLARAEPCEAVDFPSGRTFEGHPADWPLAAEGIGETIVEMHPAVERLGLGPAALASILGPDAATFGEIAPGLGLLTGPAGPIADADASWFRAVRVLETVPAKLDRVEGALRRIVDDLGPRALVVRTRGRAIDVDAWTRRLAPVAGGPGSNRIIEVGGWRIGRRQLATISIPLPSCDQSAP